MSPAISRPAKAVALGETQPTCRTLGSNGLVCTPFERSTLYLVFYNNAGCLVTGTIVSVKFPDKNYHAYHTHAGLAPRPLQHAYANKRRYLFDLRTKLALSHTTLDFVFGLVL